MLDAADLDAAVDAAFAWAPPGGVVLLSPAAPSFGRFGDYRERSAAFAAGGGPLRDPQLNSVSRVRRRAPALRAR